MSWTIKHRALVDQWAILAESRHETESEARAAFEAGRARALEHGGSAVLLRDGEPLASYSLWSPND